MIGRTADTTSPTGLCGVRTTSGEASSGSQAATGSAGAITPSSTRVMAAAATIGLVTEARRKTESRRMGVLPESRAEPATATSTRTPRSPWEP